MTMAGDPASHRAVPVALRGIAVFKFTKSALLASLAVGLHALDDPSVMHRLSHALGPFAAGHHLLAGWLAAVPVPPAGRWSWFAVLALAYASVFLVEGIGLWRGRRWGEYLTVAVTASLIPFEVWENWRHPGWLRVLVLVANGAILAYLIVLLRRSRAAGAAT